MKPSMPQFLKCMAPVDFVNCTALDERLTVSADMEKESDYGTFLRVSVHTHFPEENLQINDYSP